MEYPNIRDEQIQLIHNILEISIFNEGEKIHNKGVELCIWSLLHFETTTSEFDQVQIIS